VKNNGKKERMQIREEKRVKPMQEAPKEEIIFKQQFLTF